MKQHIMNVVLVHGAFADGSGWEAVARRTQAQAETRGVSGRFVASGNVRRQPPFGGGTTGGVGESGRFY